MTYKRQQKNFTENSVNIQYNYTRIANEVTVCPGSSDQPEKIFNIFPSENEVQIFINYYDTLG